MINKIFKNRLIYQILFSFVPVVIVSIVLFRSNLNIFNVHMVNQILNDEPFYAKQIENVLYHGRPVGYFGYNESRALIGGFGAWSPILIYVYSLFYKVINVGMDTLYFVNLIMVILALMFTYIYCDCSKKECLSYSIIFLSPLIIRFSFSGMSEAFFYAGIFLFFAFYKKKNKYLGLITIFIYSLIRPYFIIFYPLFLFEKEKTIKSIINVIFISLINLILYFLITHYFTAPYLFPQLRVSDIVSLFSFNLIETIKELIKYVSTNFNNFVLIIKNGFIYGDLSAAGFVQYLTIVLIFMLNLKNNLIAKKIDYIYMIIILIVMLLATINIYHVGASVRHLLVIMIFPVLYLLDVSIKTNSNKNVYILLFSTLLLNLHFFKIHKNLWRTIDFSDYLIEEEIFDNFDSNKTGYSNTISFEYDTDFDLYHVMFSIPSSYAISFCTTDYLLHNEPLSEYIIVSTESPTISKMDENLSLIYKNDKLIVYKK